MFALSDGRVNVTYQAAVRVLGSDGSLILEAQEMTKSLEEFENYASGLYCAGCRRRFHLVDLQLVDALQRKQSWLILEHEGFMQDPMGVLERRHGGP